MNCTIFDICKLVLTNLVALFIPEHSRACIETGLADCFCLIGALKLAENNGQILKPAMKSLLGLSLSCLSIHLRYSSMLK